MRLLRALGLFVAWPAGIFVSFWLLLSFDHAMLVRFGPVPLILWVPVIAFWLWRFARYCWHRAK